MVCVHPNPKMTATLPHQPEADTAIQKSTHTFTEGLYQQVHTLGFALGDYDFLVVSDGSGYYKDSIGGAVTAIVPMFNADETEFEPPLFVLLAQTNTTTSRMEFQGLLNGLNAIQQSSSYYPGCRVLWISDSQSTVDSVNGDAGAHQNGDLWVLFDYYAKDIVISAVHTSRDNKILLHNLCDLHSSNLRELLISYINESTNFKV